jgi:hypothetical protein
MRLVVCSIGGDGGPLELPASRVGSRRSFPSGGERSLYEVAVGAAALGVDVELRGDINRRILGDLVAAAGASPRVGLAPRPPDPADVVVLPEAPAPRLVSAVCWSGARRVVHLLAPPGFAGPSWLPGWEAPDPLTLDPTFVGRPESFAAWKGLGFTLWTNAHGIADAGASAGVDVTWVGTGTPVPPPTPPEKAFDVAIVSANRWAPLAEELVSRIEGATVLRIPPTPSSYSLAPALAPARLLLWPTRIEGMSRIAREARSVGTVPVALDTNPFVTPEDWGAGCVRAPDLDALVAATADLLAGEDRRQSLAEEARAGFREQADWPRFLERLDAAIQRVDGDVADTARAILGADLRELVDEQQGHLTELEGFIRGLQDEVATAKESALYLEKQLGDARAGITGLERLVAGVRAERDEAVRRGSVVDRQAAQIAALTEALATAHAELDAFRARRIVRLADQSRPARLLSRVRSNAK